MSRPKVEENGSSSKKINRSRVFILDKKTGEPKDLLSVQEYGEPWLLVLTDEDGRNRGKKFKRFKTARNTADKIREQHPDLEITIVSRRVGYGPPRSRISDDDLHEQNARGRLWCPFCRKFREFDIDPTWNWERCPICRIPTHNFHVIRNNPRLTWERV